jgi:hypothetical protein
MPFCHIALLCSITPRRPLPLHFLLCRALCWIQKDQTRSFFSAQHDHSLYGKTQKECTVCYPDNPCLYGESKSPFSSLFSIHPALLCSWCSQLSIIESPPVEARTHEVPVRIEDFSHDPQLWMLAILSNRSTNNHDSLYSNPTDHTFLLWLVSERHGITPPLVFWEFLHNLDNYHLPSMFQCRHAPQLQLSRIEMQPSGQLTATF